MADNQGRRQDFCLGGARFPEDFLARKKILAKRGKKFCAKREKNLGVCVPPKSASPTLKNRAKREKEYRANREKDYRAKRENFLGFAPPLNQLRPP